MPSLSNRLSKLEERAAVILTPKKLQRFVMIEGNDEVGWTSCHGADRGPLSAEQIADLTEDEDVFLVQVVFPLDRSLDVDI